MGYDGSNLNCLIKWLYRYLEMSEMEAPWRYFSNRQHILQVLSFVRKKQKNKKPASIIRLGDGEGRLLGFPELVKKQPDDLSDKDSKYLDYSLNIWFGHTDFDEGLLKDISSQLRQAVKHADIIGLPRKNQYRAHGAYRLVFDAMDRYQLWDDKQAYTDAALHRYLQFGLFYSDILDHLDFAGIITGRKNLARLVQRAFNITHVDEHLIPEEAQYATGAIAEHFPSRFNALKQEINVPYKGAVYLVGAGALGKIYCQWIKQAGGIAIDIGSICDSWSKQGRKMREDLNIDDYMDSNRKILSLKDKIERFNKIIDEINIDTEKMTDKHLEQFFLIEKQMRNDSERT